MTSKHHFCAKCGIRQGDLARTLLQCQGCFNIYYCSTACQYAFQPRHKSACQLQQAVLAKAAGNGQPDALMDALESWLKVRGSTAYPIICSNISSKSRDFHVTTLNTQALRLHSPRGREFATSHCVLVRAHVVPTSDDALDILVDGYTIQSFGELREVLGLAQDKPLAGRVVADYDLFVESVKKANKTDETFITSLTAFKIQLGSVSVYRFLIKWFQDAHLGAGQGWRRLEAGWWPITRDGMNSNPFFLKLT